MSAATRDAQQIIVVVGGGVVGLTCALELARSVGARADVSVELWREKRGQAPPNAMWEVPPYKVSDLLIQFDCYVQRLRRENRF